MDVLDDESGNKIQMNRSLSVLSALLLAYTEWSLMLRKQMEIQNAVLVMSCLS